MLSIREKGEYHHTLMEDSDYLPMIADVHAGKKWAVLLAAAPELEEVLRDLVAWEEYMGGWEYPAWEKAKKLLEKIHVQ